MASINPPGKTTQANTYNGLSEVSVEDVIDAAMSAQTVSEDALSVA